MEDISLDTIGLRLKYARKMLKLNQSDFAEKLKMNRTSIVNYEAGNKPIPERTLQSICVTFGINYDFLILGSGTPFNGIPNEFFNTLRDKYNLDETDIEVINKYIKLRPETKEAFKNFLNKLSKELFIL